MRRTILLAILTVTMLSARSARACGRGGGGGYYALVEVGMVALSLDIGFTGFDGIAALADHHPGTGAGVFELGVYTLWTGVLTSHALWTLSTQPEEHRAPYAALSLTWVPLSQHSAPGLGMVGRF